MGFFDSLNGGLETFFKELGKSKRLNSNRRYQQFKELEATPFLLDSNYLLELADGANQQEYDILMDYLYRFNNHPVGEEDHLNILGISSYKEVENKLIDRKWR